METFSEVNTEASSTCDKNHRSSRTTAANRKLVSNPWPISSTSTDCIICIISVLLDVTEIHDMYHDDVLYVLFSLYNKVLHGADVWWRSLSKHEFLEQFIDVERQQSPDQDIPMAYGSREVGGIQSTSHVTAVGDRNEVREEEMPQATINMRLQPAWRRINQCILLKGA